MNSNLIFDNFLCLIHECECGYRGINKDWIKNKYQCPKCNRDYKKDPSTEAKNLLNQIGEKK